MVLRYKKGFYHYNMHIDDIDYELFNAVNRLYFYLTCMEYNEFTELTLCSELEVVLEG